MLAVNVKETENVKIEEDAWTRHKETVKEQNGLNRKQLEYEKSKEIEKEMKNHTKKVKEEAKNKDWYSLLIGVVSILPSGLIDFFTGFLVQNKWKKVSVYLVFVIVLMILLYFIEKSYVNSIRKEKLSIRRNRMEIYYGEIKKEKSQELKDDIEYHMEQQKTQEKNSWNNIDKILRHRTALKKGIILSIFVVGFAGVVSFAAALNTDSSEVNTNNSAEGDGGDVETTLTLEATPMPEITPTLEVMPDPEITSAPEVDETEAAFRYLWNVYLGNLETCELKDAEMALTRAKQFCAGWDKDIKDTGSWAYTDMELYSWDAFNDTFSKEKSLSVNTNVNASILLELGKSYSNSVDTFLESNGDSNVTERTVGLACLRGTDIYMSVLRHKVTRNAIKEECYKSTALLLREFADEVYEGKEYKESDEQQKQKYSAKEFVLYTFSTVCYEEAAKYGDTSWKGEAEKMWEAAKNVWNAFEEYVP